MSQVSDRCIRRGQRRTGPFRRCLEATSDQLEDEHSTHSSVECHVDPLPLHETVVDLIESPSPSPPTLLHDEPIGETSPLPTFDSLIHDLLCQGISPGRLAATFGRATQTGLIKTDHSTSTSFLSPRTREPSNVAQNCLTSLFVDEQASSRHPTLGRHEHWIADALASYTHPFHHHAHQSCALLLPPIESQDDQRKGNEGKDDYPRGARSSK